MNDTLIGAGIVAFLAIFLFVKFKESLEKQSRKNKDPFSIAFMLLLFAIFVYSLFLIGKTAYEDQNYCEVLPVNVSNNGSFSTLDYSRVCFVNSNKSADGLFYIVNFFMYACLMFLGVLLLWFMWLFVKDLYERYGGVK